MKILDFLLDRKTDNQRVIRTLTRKYNYIKKVDFKECDSKIFFEPRDIDVLYNIVTLKEKIAQGNRIKIKIAPKVFLSFNLAYFLLNNGNYSQVINIYDPNAEVFYNDSYRSKIHLASICKSILWDKLFFREGRDIDIKDFVIYSVYGDEMDPSEKYSNFEEPLLRETFSDSALCLRCELLAKNASKR